MNLNNSFRIKTWKQPTSIYDKNSKKTRNRAELPQINKEYLQKKPQS